MFNKSLLPAPGRSSELLSPVDTFYACSLPKMSVARQLSYLLPYSLIAGLTPLVLLINLWTLATVRVSAQPFHAMLISVQYCKSISNVP